MLNFIIIFYTTVFQVDFSDNHMLLSYDNCCMLQCKKVGDFVLKKNVKPEARYLVKNSDSGFPFSYTGNVP